MSCAAVGFHYITQDADFMVQDKVSVLEEKKTTIFLHFFFPIFDQQNFFSKN
jgi:hypothetical protein